MHVVVDVVVYGSGSGLDRDLDLILDLDQTADLRPGPRRRSSGSFLAACSRVGIDEEGGRDGAAGGRRAGKIGLQGPRTARRERETAARRTRALPVNGTAPRPKWTFDAFTVG